MSSQVHVAMGSLAVSLDQKQVLETFVGSCVALCLFDPHARVGGMAHVMLPESYKKSSSKLNDSGKYADQAIENLLLIMLQNGGKLGRIRAKMAGGANMFTHESGTTLFNIGEKNVHALRKFLKLYNIPIVSEDVGLNYGRKVEFNVKSGELVVSSRFKGERRL